MDFFNFTTDENFNLEDEYNKINQVPLQTENEKKISDAENIIDQIGSRYIEFSSLQKFEELHKSLESFLIKFSTENEDVVVMTAEQRDKLYGYGQGRISSSSSKKGSIYCRLFLRQPNCYNREPIRN